ncbi:MAG: CoA transferase [Gammaproteobacteria bacterium]|nr:MAG: CoA transferase [Gammaproteobacteria bacterium]
MDHSKRTGPLADVTIIDCTMALAGPFGTGLLADLGANVIKVEPPEGDAFRPLPPFPPDYGHAAKGAEGGVDYGAPFAGVNRNKRSIQLDLKQAGDWDTLLELCTRADAIVENMRAGVMDKLGLGYETIAERNPRIVYGAVRGFGDPRTGDSPYSAWPCLDVAAQSFGGLVDANGELSNVAIADIYPGTLLALGLVSAVYNAKQTGHGQFFDVAMYDAMLAMLQTNVAAYGLSGKVASEGPRRRVLVPFGLFPTSDGRVAIAAPQPNHWEALCHAMDREDLLSDERTRSNGCRVRNPEFTEAQIAAWTSQYSKDEIVQALGGRVPVGPANNMGDIFADPHTAAREMIQRFQLPGDNPEAAVAGNPIKFAGTPTGFYQAPPQLGEHTDAILAEFGLTQADPQDPDAAS